MIYVLITKAACVFVIIFIKFASLNNFMILITSVLVILLCLFLLYNNFSKNKNSIYLCGSLIFMCITSKTIILNLVKILKKLMILVHDQLFNFLLSF